MRGRLGGERAGAPSFPEILARLPRWYNHSQSARSGAGDGTVGIGRDGACGDFRRIVGAHRLGRIGWVTAYSFGRRAFCAGRPGPPVPTLYWEVFG